MINHRIITLLQALERFNKITYTELRQLNLVELEVSKKELIKTTIVINEMIETFYPDDYSDDSLDIDFDELDELDDN